MFETVDLLDPDCLKAFCEMLDDIDPDALTAEETAALRALYDDLVRLTESCGAYAASVNGSIERITSEIKNGASAG